MTDTIATTGETIATTELSISAPELANENGKITTTSLQVAQHFSKAHNLVMRAIRNLGCSAEFRLCNFAQSSYLNEQGKQQPMYRLTKDGFMFLAMGFTGKEADQWKEAYIAEFNRREAELVKLQAPQPERIAYSVNPTDTLNAAQAEQLRMIFKEKCDTLPKDDQAGFMIKAWSKLKSHFGVVYRKIPQFEFSEAVSLATRHCAEWGALPAPQQLSLPIQTEPTAQRFLVEFNPQDGLRTLKPVSGSCMVIEPNDLPDALLFNVAKLNPELRRKIAQHACIGVSVEVSKIEDLTEGGKAKAGLGNMHISDLLSLEKAMWQEIGVRSINPPALAA